jgi:hypothetical protein
MKSLLILENILLRTFDVELKKASKNGILRDDYLTSEKSNAHFMRVYRIISHQRLRTS